MVWIQEHIGPFTALTYPVGVKGPAVWGHCSVNRSFATRRGSSNSNGSAGDGGPAVRHGDYLFSLLKESSEPIHETADRGHR